MTGQSIAKTDPTRGRAFDDEDVARAYANRAPYPPELIDRLSELAPRLASALDLGCGPGKLARPLADLFERVDAVDPAAPMIAAGRELDDGLHQNIAWLVASAEDAQLHGPYDLVTAGASIHWMDHQALFPRLCTQMAPDGIVAIVGGDEAADPPWAQDWPELMSAWIGRMGGTYDRRTFGAEMTAHETWMDIAGRETITSTLAQTVEAFIDGEHSRGTWTRRKMGVERTAAFDADLRALLTPHALDGVLTYRVETRLTYGRPRSAPSD
jgi:trans-aconitate methyltransferase